MSTSDVDNDSNHGRHNDQGDAVLVTRTSARDIHDQVHIQHVSQGVEGPESSSHFAAAEEQSRFALTSAAPEQAAGSKHAVHRTILAVDVKGFGDRRRTNPDQLVVRDGLYQVLRRSFERSGISWVGCDHEDRGDGVLILIPPQVAKSPFVERLPYELVTALREHNSSHCVEQQIRLRMALHAGEIHYDNHGVAGASINLACRLLDAEILKSALADTPGALALITSSWFFDEVVRHSVVGDPTAYRQVQVVVKETSTTAWIYLPNQLHLSTNASPTSPRTALFSQRQSPTTVSTLSHDAPKYTLVPRQLPAHTPHFVGRTGELEALTRVLAQTAEPGITAVISGIDGSAGIGKTTLAVWWARHVQDRFPDGQLYVNLRGFDPTGPPMKPTEAIRGFLDAFEIPPERIPTSPDAQACLYRSLLVDKRVLVVLDNARNADQVRPLLPGSPTCLVLVTSRSQLASLVAVEGAHPITLDVLTASESRELLACYLGAERVAAEPAATENLIACCAQLPLALAIVAARAAAHPGFPLAVLAAEVQDAGARLDALDGGDAAADVRAVFSWSYHGLSSAAARLFRLLGLHPGPDLTTAAAASLAGIPLVQARQALAELTRAHLLEQHVPKRFAFHDLLRTYATEQTYACDNENERRTAVHRMLDHYLHTAYTAALLLYPDHHAIALASPQSGVRPEILADYWHALAWFDAEHPVLLGAIQQAAEDNFDTHAWQLAWTLPHFFERRAYWHDQVITERTALNAALRLGNREGQARAHRGLGCGSVWLGRYRDAHAHLHRALELFSDLGERVGQAHIHLNLAWVHTLQEHHRDALNHARQALDLFRAANHRGGQARALSAIGKYHSRLGDSQQALVQCQQALVLQRALDDRYGEATTLDTVGDTHHQLGHHREAIAFYEQSLHLFRKLDARYNQADALTRLGDTYHSSGDVGAARHTWQQALDILNQLDHPDADQVHSKLAKLDNKRWRLRPGRSNDPGR